MSELNLTKIGITKLKSIHLPEFKNNKKHIQMAMTLNHEFMNLGFIMTEDLFNRVANMCANTGISIIQNFFGQVIEILKETKGAHIEHKPMYPNFPNQVTDAEDIELFLNQIMHYWTNGCWIPSTEKEARKFGLEQIKYTFIDLCTEEDIKDVFTTLLKSNDSIKSSNKKIIEYFINNYNEKDLVYPNEIPYKENVCIVAAMFIRNNKSIKGLIKTATDILRIATYMSDGDISLSENTKFKSFKRPVRRILIKSLESVIKEEDIKRHKGKWVKLAHSLHVGDYSKKVYDIISKPRSNTRLRSVLGDVELYLADGNVVEATKLLTKRPGEFARKLDYLLRTYKENTSEIIYNFYTIINNVSTRVLLQVHSHFQYRNNEDCKRVIIPKGLAQKAISLPKHDVKIREDVVLTILSMIEESLKDRFKDLGSMGKVYLDEGLKKCPIPSQMRSAVEGANTVARGTVLPMIDSINTIRLFIYWVGRDIDLSATIHDENFEEIAHCSYTDLRSNTFKYYHSGDIVNAPAGASEFIDIDIDSVLNNGGRYVVMNVLVYNGPSFVEHETCFAGWMYREFPKSNEIFEPETVVNKFDLINSARHAMPAVFDLKNKEVIWCDLGTTESSYYGGLNIESNRSSIEDVLQSIVSMNKFSLYDLFKLHIDSRGGELVEDIDNDDLEYIFSVYDGINPTDVELINSEFII